jgi:hypothetical protein
MKKSRLFYIVIILVAFIIITSITLVFMIFLQKSKANEHETVAKAVLTKTYGATLKDYENLTNALIQSTKNNEMLVDYIKEKYGEQLTDNGYTRFLSSRVALTAAKFANEENSDLKVSSIELEPEAAVAGGKRFDFIVQVHATKDDAKAFTFEGSISLIHEDGHWKVDGITPL